MSEPNVQALKDLATLRTAPALSDELRILLRSELDTALKAFDWFTVGVMAPSTDAALQALRGVETTLLWKEMRVEELPKDQGPVFLKANQSTGLIRIRIEHGLGEGVLISGHSTVPEQPGMTWGPFPLDFFS